MTVAVGLLHPSPLIISRQSHALGGPRHKQPWPCVIFVWPAHQWPSTGWLVERAGAQAAAVFLTPTSNSVQPSSRLPRSTTALRRTRYQRPLARHATTCFLRGPDVRPASARLPQPRLALRLPPSHSHHLTSMAAHDDRAVRLLGSGRNGSVYEARIGGSACAIKTVTPLHPPHPSVRADRPAVPRQAHVRDRAPRLPCHRRGARPPRPRLPLPRRLRPCRCAPPRRPPPARAASRPAAGNNHVGVITGAATRQRAPATAPPPARNAAAAARRRRVPRRHQGGQRHGLRQRQPPPAAVGRALAPRHPDRRRAA